MTELSLLFLLIVANASPVAARLVFGKTFARPLDGGMIWTDDHRLLGASKTLRGLVSATLTTAACALLVGFSWYVGVLIALAAMLGDALSSFVKRRLGLQSGAMAPALDQVPESLLPLLACKPLLILSWTQIAVLTIGFTIADLLLSRVLFHLGFRQHPH